MKLPPPEIIPPDGFFKLANGATVERGDYSLEPYPMRWEPVLHGGYIVSIGIYIRKVAP